MLVAAVKFSGEIFEERMSVEVLGRWPLFVVFQEALFYDFSQQGMLVDDLKTWVLLILDFMNFHRSCTNLAKMTNDCHWILDMFKR